jgi:PmbA protein
MGEVDTIEHHRDPASPSVCFALIQRTADIAPAAVRETVAKAAAIARYTAADECAGLLPRCCA